MIKLINVVKNYGDNRVFSDFNLTLVDGEITAVLGESGVGKTTLLNIISGHTGFEGKVENAPEKCSFVFQEDRLLPFKTAEGNLEFALGKGDYSAYFEKVGLRGCENKYPGELSGGMNRRVSLLRAFLYKSDALLMDEPFSSLDIGTKYSVMDYFLKMWKEDGRTAVFVTHSPEEAAYVSDRAVVIGEGGKILFDERNPFKTSGSERDLADFAMKITSVFIKKG